MRWLLNWLESCLLWILDKQIISLKPHFFLSEDEMVAHLLKHLPEECKQTIREMKQPQLIYLTEDIVNAIENYYWLWDKRNPFTEIQKGSAKHPTNVAFHVLARVHEILREDASNDKTI